MSPRAHSLGACCFLAGRLPKSSCRYLQEIQEIRVVLRSRHGRIERVQIDVIKSLHRRRSAIASNHPEAIPSGAEFRLLLLTQTTLSQESAKVFLQ